MGSSKSWEKWNSSTMGLSMQLIILAMTPSSTQRHIGSELHITWYWIRLKWNAWVLALSFRIRRSSGLHRLLSQLEVAQARIRPTDQRTCRPKTTSVDLWWLPLDRRSRVAACNFLQAAVTQTKYIRTLSCGSIKISLLQHSTVAR